MSGVDLLGYSISSCLLSSFSFFLGNVSVTVVEVIVSDFVAEAAVEKNTTWLRFLLVVEDVP